MLKHALYTLTSNILCFPVKYQQLVHTKLPMTTKDYDPDSEFH